MKVIILTHWPGVVMEIVDQQFEKFMPHNLKEGRFSFELVLQLDNDVDFRDWQGWGSDALACGLVFGFQIERSGE